MLRKLIFILCLPVMANAQELDKRYVDKGILRTQGNIALGSPVGSGGTNIYLGGELEYYVDPDVSIRGEIFYFLGDFGTNTTFNHNHSGFLGALYHIKTNGHFDPYLGIAPGYAISQLKKQDLIFIAPYEGQISTYPVTVNPLLSFDAGFNYYANRFFNLFIHVKYVMGKHYSDIEPVSLNEVKMTFGLGYHIWATKKHVGFRKPGYNK